MPKIDVDAVLAEIERKLKRRFPIGCKVKMSPEGRRSFPNYADRIGEVVGYYQRVSPKVLFEGRVTSSSWHPDFLHRIHQ